MKLLHDQFKCKAESFQWDEKRLLHKIDRYWVICIRSDKVTSMLERTHDDSEHFFSKIVLKKLQYWVFWSEMIRDVHKYLLRCIHCMRFFNALLKKPLKLIIVMQSFFIIRFNHIEPLSRTDRENTHIMIIVNYFIRFSWVRVMNSVVTSQAVKFLQWFFLQFVISIAAHSDWAVIFISSNFRKFMTTYRVIHTFAASDTHRLTEMIEQINLIIEKVMCKYDDQSVSEADSEQEIKKVTVNWDQLLLKIMHAVNSHHIEHLRYTLNEILYEASSEELLDKESIYASEEREGITLLITSEELNIMKSENMTTSVINFMKWRENQQHKVHNNSVEEKIRMKKRYDHSVFDQHLKIEDMIMLWITQSAVWNQREHKLSTQWDRSFCIIQYDGEHRTTYTLRYLNSERIVRKSSMRIEPTYHRDRLQKFVSQKDHLISSSEGSLSEREAMLKDPSHRN